MKIESSNWSGSWSDPCENDKIKFTLVSHSAGDDNRTFVQLPDKTWLDTFDSAAFLEGAVVDESSDCPIDGDLGLITW